MIDYLISGQKNKFWIKKEFDFKYMNFLICNNFQEFFKNFFEFNLNF